MKTPFNAGTLELALRRLRDGALDGRYCIAWSGGIDSSALLHALCELAAARPGIRLRAVHVEHGLHADSPRWARHCRSVSAALGVTLQVRRVRVRNGGRGVEAAAREARYAALQSSLTPGEVLLTAHHLDDQAETVLLQLLRGAGPRGLAGMAACRPFGPGSHLRPLLGFDRAALQAYARAAGLECLEDPANDDARFARSYLRRRIMPSLRERWPAASRSIARAARHQAQAGALIETAAAQAATPVIAGDCLRVDRLVDLEAPMQAHVLRLWIRSRGFAVPASARLRSILDTVLHCRADAAPQVSWAGVELRRYRDRLYLLVPLSSLASSRGAAWRIDRPLELPAGLGRLRAVPVIGAGIRDCGPDATLEVAFRRGGERIRPAGGAHRRALKKLFQETGIVPWMRGRIPLIYVPAGLAAVADLWREHAHAAGPGEPGLEIEWLDHPPLY